MRGEGLHKRRAKQAKTASEKIARRERKIAARRKHKSLERKTLVHAKKREARPVTRLPTHHIPLAAGAAGA